MSNGPLNGKTAFIGLVLALAINLSTVVYFIATVATRGKEVAKDVEEIKIELRRCHDHILVDEQWRTNHIREHEKLDNRLEDING